MRESRPEGLVQSSAAMIPLHRRAGGLEAMERLARSGELQHAAGVVMIWARSLGRELAG